MRIVGHLVLGSIISCFMMTCVHAIISCPPMPQAVTSVNSDIKSEITASVGTLGKIKAGDISIKTEVQANNLFAKYPNVDKLFALQTISATYCEILMKSTIPEAEKINRWERFQDKVLNLSTSSNLPSHSPAGSRSNNDRINVPTKSINPKSYPLLAGMRIGVMYIERESKYMVETKNRLKKVDANVTTNEVTDWRGYPEYVGRLLYNPGNIKPATQLKGLVSDILVARLYETREIFDKYDLVIWLDPVK